MMGSRKDIFIILISVIALVFLTNTVHGQEAGQDGSKCIFIRNKSGQYSIAKSDLKQLFANAFKTKTQLQNETTIPVSPFTSLVLPRQRAIRPTQSQSTYNRREAAVFSVPCPRGDDSCCCRTCRHYTKYTKVNDTSGTEWFVVHFPEDGMYQWVEVGMCGDVRSATCESCIQEYNFQSVLVSYEDPASDDTALSISLVQAAFPAYCKCACTGGNGPIGQRGLPGPPGFSGPSGPRD